MRILKLPIASVVVLLVVAVSARAGVMLQVTPLPSPHPLLEAFLVTAVADSGDLVGSFADMTLTGVHSVTENAIGGGQSTSADEIGGTFWNPIWDAWDTRILLDLGAPTLTLSPGFVIGETNDGSNPAGLTPIELEGPAPFGAFGGTAGVGDLAYSVSTDQITLLAPRPESIAFLQVVIPIGTTANLSVTLLSDNNDVTPLSVAISGVPEPATILLAGMGFIGIFAGRRRSL